MSKIDISEDLIELLVTTAQIQEAFSSNPYDQNLEGWCTAAKEVQDLITYHQNLEFSGRVLVDDKELFIKEINYWFYNKLEKIGKKNYCMTDFGYFSGLSTFALIFHLSFGKIKKPFQYWGIINEEIENRVQYDEIGSMPNGSKIYLIKKII